MANMFAKPLYEDDQPNEGQITAEDRADPALSGLTDEQIVTAKTNNLFARPVFEEEAAPPAEAPAEQPNEFVQGAKNMGYAAAQGLGGAFNKLSGSIGTVLGSNAIIYDYLSNMFTGEKSTEAQDSWFKMFVDPAVEAQTNFEVGHEAPFRDRAAHAMGSMLGIISQIVLTSGGGAAPEATMATSAPGAVGAVVRGAAEHGVKAMAVPAVSDAVDTGRKVLEATGDGKKATTAAQMQYITSTLAGVVPLSAAGGVAKRAATGAVSGATVGELSRELMNTVMPERLQQATEAADVALDALAGGTLGTVMGPRSSRPPSQGSPLEALSEPLGDGAEGAEPQTPPAIDAALQVPEGPSAIQQAAEAARERVRAEGGDALAQELAAAKAMSETSEQHAGAFYEHSSALERRQLADEAAMEQRQVEEQAALEAAAQTQARAEVELGKTAHLQDYEPVGRPRAAEENIPRPVTAKDIAFERADAERGSAKAADTERAYAERELQDAQRVVEEPRPATLADVAPESVRQLGKSKPEAPQEPRPLNLFERAEYEPEAPKNLTERRALPAPRTARFEVSREGVARPVTEGEMQARGAERSGLAIRREAIQQERPVVHVAEERRGPTYEEVSTAAHEAATSPRNERAEPTEAQREAGNYKKGHVQVHGLDVSIENPKGSVRKYSGGERRMRDHYGYIRGTEGNDGDHVDTFIGEHPESDRVFVIDQLRPEGGFDEHKVLIGYRNRLDAVRAYKRNYQAGWKVGPVTEMSVSEFKTWLREGDTKAPLKPAEIPRAGTPEKVEAARSFAQRRGLRFREGDITQEKPSATRNTTDFKLEGKHGEDAGTLTTIRRGDVHQVYESGIAPEMRGKGHGVRMYEEAVKVAHAEGRALVSDTMVSDAAARMYDALERRGYDVRRNENVERENDSLRSTDTRPVFEVHPPKKETTSRTGLQEVHPGFTRIPKGTRVQFSRGVTYKNAVGKVVGERVMRLGDDKLYAVPEVETPDGRVVRLAPSNIEKVFRPRTLEREGPHVEREARVPHEEAVRVVEPLTREMPRLEPKVLRNHTEAPPEVRAEIEHLGQQDARGVYDPATDTVYIFSENHDSAAEVLRTALHEGVAHKGLRHLLTSEFTRVMEDIHARAIDKAWLTDFMAQHGLDSSNPEHRITAAEEYAASLAERMERDPSLWRKVVDAVRSALRKVGLTRTWTENDIRALLRKARTSLRDRSAHATDRYGNLRFADKEYTEQAERLPDDHPLNVFLKQGATVEEQAGYNPGFVRSRLDALRDFGENNIEALLGAIPRRNLPDFVAPGKMESTRAYVREAARLDGRRNELLVKADKIANRWVKYVRQDRAGARTLGELMHAATLAGVEPANSYRPKYKNPKGPEQLATEAQRKRQWLMLRKHWNQLPSEARAIYVDVRDSYAADRDLIMKGIESRIAATAADGKTKQTLLAELRKKFEAGRVEGPYFPLGRYGKHWAVAKDADGAVVSFTRFEKPSEQRQWLAEMQRAGYQVDGGVQMQNREMARRIDPSFVAKVTDLLQQVDPSLADEVWQNYLRAMPEMSMRKHFIHRKGRLGFTMDAIRNFGHLKFHGAHQIAKLEHMHALESLLEKMKVEAVDLRRTPEEKWAAALAKEFDKRHEWMRNPNSSGVATALTSLGFMYYLGATPAAAMVNLTQNAMVAFPTLASKFNWTGAGIELTRAAGQFAGSRGDLANRLRGDERLAFDEAKRIGLFDKTMAHDLAQIGEEGMDYGSTRNRVMNLASWMFHQAEEFNRQTTFLAAYRLGRRKGASHDAAIEQAEDITWDSHFDYSNTNRARYLQSDTAKVLLLFRQYAANMTYRLARDFNDSLRGATKQQRHEARQRFTGMLGQTMLFAGASGMPLWWLATSILNTVFGDEDKPYDAEAEMRAWLGKHYGEGVASSVMDGPVSAMSGAAIYSRVGLNNLWVQEAPTGMEGKELGLFYLGQAAGPLGGLAVRAFDSAAPSPEGFGERALEKVMPKAIGDVLKAIRFVREGVTNQRGDIVVPAEQITKYDAFLQAVGFTPYKAALQYEKNRTISAYSQQIMGRKTMLKNKLYLAAHNDDPQGVKETMQEILTFNRKNPSVAIKAEDLVSSAKSRAKYSAEAINGLHVEPGLRYLYRRFDSRKGQQEEPQQ